MNDNIRVLIVDDEEQFTLNLARLLKFRGFQVATATDGFKALKAVEAEESFDVVVLDVKMPGMDGVATLSKIKKLTPNTEVIMLTGHATVESGIQAIRQGAFDYLMKPCDIEDLTEKINEACELERIKRRPVLWPRNLVKEITLPSFTKLETGDPLTRALEVFNRGAGMPVKEALYVLDKQDRFQGVVTRRDLIEAAQKDHPEHPITWQELVQNPSLLPQKTLDKVLRPYHPFAISPEENLTKVARRMIAGNARCLPVVEGDKVKGFIRLQDIFQYVEHEIE
ncbi:MAG: response regulator [Desulfobacteraceae bacterium]|jgi:CheY-like chemotaxis protein|nr:response regulator [Desulfobacteraceae bacterium]